jgi:DNA-binding LacI/PurR family transcriptional regulator
LRATVKDIARHAGVSPATVSLVLRKSPLVADTTRARIESSIDSLGYVYHRAAANLRTRLTHTVGLVICEITNPFYAELTAGIDDALDRAGWVAFVANTAESPSRQSRFIARMRDTGSTASCSRPPKERRRAQSTSCGARACLSSKCCAVSGAKARTMSAPISASA